jgi:hypothetical protein
LNELVPRLVHPGAPHHRHRCPKRQGRISTQQAPRCWIVPADLLTGQGFIDPKAGRTFCDRDNYPLRHLAEPVLLTNPPERAPPGWKRRTSTTPLASVANNGTLATAILCPAQKPSQSACLLSAGWLAGKGGFITWTAEGFGPALPVCREVAPLSPRSRRQGSTPVPASGVKSSGSLGLHRQRPTQSSWSLSARHEESKPARQIICTNEPELSLDKLILMQLICQVLASYLLKTLPSI